MTKIPNSQTGRNQNHSKAMWDQTIGFWFYLRFVCNVVLAIYYFRFIRVEVLLELNLLKMSRSKNDWR